MSNMYGVEFFRYGGYFGGVICLLFCVLAASVLLKMRVFLLFALFIATFSTCELLNQFGVDLGLSWAKIVLSICSCLLYVVMMYVYIKLENRGNARKNVRKSVVFVGTLGLCAFFFVMIFEPSYAKSYRTILSFSILLFIAGGLLLELKEIEKLRAYASKKERENVALQRLVRIICHDILNPLSVIKWINSKMLGEKKDEKVVKRLEVIENASNSIYDVIQDVRTKQAIVKTARSWSRWF